MLEFSTGTLSVLPKLRAVDSGSSFLVGFGNHHLSGPRASQLYLDVLVQVLNCHMFLFFWPARKSLWTNVADEHLLRYASFSGMLATVGLRFLDNTKFHFGAAEEILVSFSWLLFLARKTGVMSPSSPSCWSGWRNDTCFVCQACYPLWRWLVSLAVGSRYQQVEVSMVEAEQLIHHHCKEKEEHHQLERSSAYSLEVLPNHSNSGYLWVCTEGRAIGGLECPVGNKSRGQSANKFGLFSCIKTRA